jgi:hypothetical protein
MLVGNGKPGLQRDAVKCRDLRKCLHPFLQTMKLEERIKLEGKQRRMAWEARRQAAANNVQQGPSCEVSKSNEHQDPANAQVGCFSNESALQSLQ